MKNGRTLQELASELTRQKETKQDFIAETSALEMLPNQELVIKGHGQYPIKNLAHKQIGQRLGIPAKYYEKMQNESPDLLAQNVNHWFEANPEKRMIRTLDNHARAFLSQSYRPLDNFDLAMSALPRIQELGCDVLSCEVTESRMYLKCVTERITTEVTKGDVVQAGICISNSEVGNGSLKIEPLVYRLVCMNGMIANDYRMRKYHVGRANDIEGAAEFFRDETRQRDDEAFFMKVQDLISAALDQTKFNTIVNSMREGTERRIEGDPVKVLENVAKTHMISDGESGNILNHLISGGSLTQYALGNAITRMAQDSDSYDRSTDLERVGGQVMLMPANDWNKLTKVA